MTERPGTCNAATVADWCDVGRMTIDMLPDVALLEVFDYYVNQAREEEGEIQAWQMLVHVCRKWRTIVLEYLSHHVAWIFDFSARRKHL